MRSATIIAIPMTTASLANSAGCYSVDYDWVHARCLDGGGQPLQQRGVGQVPGVYFLGLHWMHTFKSGTFLGIGDDAAYVVDHLVTHALRS